MNYKYIISHRRTTNYWVRTKHQTADGFQLFYFSLFSFSLSFALTHFVSFNKADKFRVRVCVCVCTTRRHMCLCVDESVLRMIELYVRAQWACMCSRFEPRETSTATDTHTYTCTHARSQPVVDCEWLYVDEIQEREERAECMSFAYTCVRQCFDLLLSLSLSLPLPLFRSFFSCLFVCEGMSLCLTKSNEMISAQYHIESNWVNLSQRGRDSRRRRYKFREKKRKRESAEQMYESKERRVQSKVWNCSKWIIYRCIGNNKDARMHHKCRWMITRVCTCVRGVSTWETFIATIIHRLRGCSRRQRSLSSKHIWMKSWGRNAAQKRRIFVLLVIRDGR